MKNRLAFVFGFLALALITPSLCEGVEWNGISPRQVAEGGGGVAGGIKAAPKQIADGQETHGFKPSNA